MNVWRAAASCLAVISLLAACAGAPREQGGTVRSAGADCLQAARVRSYEQLDQRNLILYAPDRQHAYHVELEAACAELGFGSLSIEGSHGRVCGYSNATIRSAFGSTRGLGGNEVACRITRVNRLEASTLQELLLQHGRGERGEPAAGEVEQIIP